MPKRTYTFHSTDHAVCRHSDCPLADKCLQQLAYPTFLDCQTYLSLINPNLCSKDEKFKFFLYSKPVVYACGFTNSQRYTQSIIRVS